MTRFAISPEHWACERAGLEAPALVDRQVVVIDKMSTTSVKRIKIPKTHIGLNLHVMLSSEMIHQGRAQLVLEGAHS